MNDSKIAKLTDFLRKDLQDTLDTMLNRNIGVEKYWEYIGRLNLAKQLLGRVGSKIRVSVFVESEGT